MFKCDNPSRWRRVVRREGHSDKTKLAAAVAFSNSGKALNKDKVVIWYTTPCLLVICCRGLGEVAASVVSLVEVK